MTKRPLRALLLALTCVAATAHCGKSESTGTPALGPTDVVVSWTFSGKPADAASCAALMAYQVSVTLSATSNPELHQHADVDCAAGTVTFAGLDVSGLGAPFLEGALLGDKGGTLPRADLTVTPTPGSTPVTLDFFPIVMASTGATSGNTSVTSGPASSSATSGATSSGSGMGGGGGSGPATSSVAATSATSATSAAATTGAGGADAGL